MLSKVFFLLWHTVPWKIISGERNDCKKKRKKERNLLIAVGLTLLRWVNTRPAQVASGRSLPSV